MSRAAATRRTSCSRTAGERRSASSAASRRTRPVGVTPIDVAAARAAGVTATAGLLWWLTRGGGLLTMMLMGIPAWRHMDMLPVLARELDDVFTAENVGETRAVVIMANGKLAAERYGPGYDKDTRFVSWSMAKTVTGVLIGMLVSDGLLALDGPAPVPQWQRPGDPRGGITLRHLLQMRSGLRHTESGDPPYESSEVRMLFLDGRDNMARWAEEQPLEAEPGKQFEYSSNTSVILADIAAREGRPDAGLRLAVEAGGCSGFQYKFGLEDVAAADDLVIGEGKGRVFVDPVSLDLLMGAELDWAEALIGAHFAINNPQASSGCGCGSSFAIG